MDEKGPYIKQLEEGESLYSGLWRTTDVRNGVDRL